MNMKTDWETFRNSKDERPKDRRTFFEIDKQSILALLYSQY